MKWTRLAPGHYAPANSLFGYVILRDACGWSVYHFGRLFDVRGTLVSAAREDVIVPYVKSDQDIGTEYARVFLTRMLAMTNDMLGEKWVSSQSPQILDARVVDLAIRTAYEMGMSSETAYAVAAYALATLQVDGQHIRTR